jgi:hypothetical protein
MKGSVEIHWGKKKEERASVDHTGPLAFFCALRDQLHSDLHEIDVI